MEDRGGEIALLRVFHLQDSPSAIANVHKVQANPQMETDKKD